MGRIEDWKIGVRMALSFALFVALMALSSAIGVNWLQKVGDATRDMVTRSLAGERLGAEWLRLTTNNSIRTIALVKSDDAAYQAYLKKGMDETSARISVIQKKLEPLLTSPQEQQLLAQLATQRTRYIDMRNAILKAKSAGNAAEAAEQTEQLIPVLDAYVASIRSIAEIQRGEIEADAASIDSMYLSGRTLLIGVGLVAVLLAAGIAWGFSRSITGPLRKAVEVARTVAAGDLGARIDVRSRDETGQLMAALREMNAKLADLVGRVRTGSEAIATASAQIAGGNRDLAQRTEEQASSLEETAASMEELAATVKQNADHARQANQLAHSASEVAAAGGVVVGQVVETMSSINASSRKVAEIVAVIDSIAFQTNILALNAAVEAARAGEQGRGFAVVASEVRALAQRSAGAAREIKALIEASVGEVDAGGQLVAKAGVTMNEVVTSIARVRDIVSEIAGASQEQTSGIAQVTQAVAQMDTVTQQNATMVEEASAAAHALHEQADQLVEAVGAFKTGADAAEAHAIRPARTASRDSLPRPIARAQVLIER